MIFNLYTYTQVIILDVRVPSIPVSRLSNHRASVNGIAWAPHSSCHICTAGETDQGRREGARERGGEREGGRKGGFV